MRQNAVTYTVYYRRLPTQVHTQALPCIKSAQDGIILAAVGKVVFLTSAVVVGRSHRRCDARALAWE